MVRFVLEVQILQVDARLGLFDGEMGAGGQDNHAGGGGLLEGREQQLSEHKMAEVVHPDLHLKALLGGPLGAVHHPGVVHQVVYPVNLLQDGLGRLPDARQVGQVQWEGDGLPLQSLQLLGLLLQELSIPRQHHHLAPLLA
eukprot:CAMPEP_0204301472 /NCGR_PEP_ID=MMETSP0468-20130131/80427_1 /ASSEMBLY_ACC=CAM_ASM_000383 /TAXON_ID=2969 /ORGANISM="Oxyrrhis marina" /LENGTH=140 /DNA_ID=CAMNT_0051280615 /DNA_START=594 /DNA_END=1016 /DNA_ORIENTATION=+